MAHPLTQILLSFAVTLSPPATVNPQSPIGDASTAEWQWSVPVASVISDETKDHPRAFLWIPPDCRRVRGAIIGQHNMLEEGVLEHPALRKAMSDLGLAAIWISPALDGNFRFDRGAGEHFQQMLTALARESGYEELAFAPVVPIGHSAMASYPYHFAAWNPGRTLAAISLKGTWPDFRDANSPPWKDTDVDGVPLLFVSGEYEDADGRAAKALDFRRRNPHSPLTMLADAGGGHFDSHDKLVEYIALYLRKAVQYRLPADAPLDRAVTLAKIDPTKQGWLVERWHKNRKPKSPPGPVGTYAGRSEEAFWCFDEELAAATQAYPLANTGKKPQLLGYVQDGQVAKQDQSTHQQVTLQFHPLDDGLTFKVSGTFIDRVPPGRPERWADRPAGSPIDHAAGGGPVVLSRICGPVVQTGPDTFTIRFYRMGTDNPKRSGAIWLLASHPGDTDYKRAVQQAVLNFPWRNDRGPEQHITFLPIADVDQKVATVRLHATSNANVPVHYYVVAGPAIVEGGALRLTAIPPRSRFPVKITVVAWQLGRSAPPLLKSAEPIERSFFVLASDARATLQHK